MTWVSKVWFSLFPRRAALAPIREAQRVLHERMDALLTRAARD